MHQVTERDELIEMASGAASTSYEQRKAIAELGKLDDQTSLQALVGLLSDDDRYLRREVVKAIGTHGSSSAVLALIHCLSDGSENVRRDAAALLGGRNDGRAVAPLRVLLDDKGYAVRHAAENSLELLDREGVEPAGFDSEALASFSSAIAASPVEPEPNVLSAPQSESKAENPAGQNHSNTAASVEAATQPSKGETESQDLSRKPQHEDQKSLDHLEGRFQNSEPPVNRVAESEPLTHAAEP